MIAAAEIQRMFRGAMFGACAGGMYTLGMVMLERSQNAASTHVQGQNRSLEQEPSIREACALTIESIPPKCASLKVHIVRGVNTLTAIYHDEQTDAKTRVIVATRAMNQLKRILTFIGRQGGDAAEEFREHQDALLGLCENMLHNMCLD
jgi:hypothetical protein